MTSRIGALVMAGLLALYLAFVAQYAVLLITSDAPAAKALGIALAVLPLLGAFTLVSELVFVRRGQRLVRMLGAEGGLPVDDLPRLPSGRPDPVAADAEFPRYKAEVEADPGSWRAWLRLGLAYDASGDRRRARWATRRAIALERSGR
ncbi:hypothetical protein PYV02_07620 [Leifsonia sp. H3M29-4]|uniref:hypothetical protein n=1 Tax=Salinibacterium metalliresistens TaxID=3031321 RepID=UPI0023D9F11E|nr:hypothetical protein [Salinibacterium metalliresistens]MDF1478953.1 hypothetical protein [Salinibacterium metalliresistens]